MSIFDKLPGAHKDGADQPVQPMNTVSDGLWFKVTAAPSDPRRPGNAEAWRKNLFGTQGMEDFS